MTDTLTSRIIAASDLPVQLETLRELAYYLRETAAHSKRVEWHVNRTIDSILLVLRQAGVSLEDVQAKEQDLRMGLKLLTLAELQDELGISRGTLMKVRKTLSFPRPVRVSGRRLAYLNTEVREWVKSGGLRQEQAESPIPDPSTARLNPC